MIEMLATLALIGILSGIALYHLKDLDDPLDNSTTQLIAFFKQVRVRAISTTSAYVVQPSSQGYIQGSYSDRCSDADTDRVIDNSVFFKFPAGARLYDTDWSVCFGPRGLPDSNLRIPIADSGSRVRWIEVFLGGGVKEIDV